MTSEEGVFHGDPNAGNMGGHESRSEPAEWPRVAEQVTQAGGWWATMLAAAGSIATVLGAVFLARRRSKRNRIIAAMPSSIADASEQVMKSREQLMHGISSGLKHEGRKSGNGPLRAVLALGALAIAGWGLRRTLAHQV